MTREDSAQTTAQAAVGTEPGTHSMDNQLLRDTITKLCEEYPEWRMVNHTTPDGAEVVMIEFATYDESGYKQYTSGLPGEFVEMVSKAGDDDA